MKRIGSAILACGLCLALGTSLGCEEEGPAERMGESIDRAVEDAKDKIDDMGSEGPMEELGREVDEAVESAKQTAEEAREAAEEAAEKAKQ